MPYCKEKLEEKFQKVKEYMADHKNVVMKQICEECDVALSQIKNRIRQDRLHTIDEDDALDHCNKCGRAVYPGNFCALCKRELLYNMEEAMGMHVTKERPKKKVNTPKMRFVKR